MMHAYFSYENNRRRERCAENWEEWMSKRPKDVLHLWAKVLLVDGHVELLIATSYEDFRYQLEDLHAISARMLLNMYIILGNFWA